MYSDMTQSQHPRCISFFRTPRVPGADPQRQGEEEQGDTVVRPHAGFLCSWPPDPEKSCQPLLETLRQAIDGTVYTHSTLELQTLQPGVNFLATTTVPGFCEQLLCPRLSRLFTVLALGSVTQATLLSRHMPSIQAWLERFPSVERESVLARALVRASLEAWEAVGTQAGPGHGLGRGQGSPVLGVLGDRGWAGPAWQALCPLRSSQASGTSLPSPPMPRGCCHMEARGSWARP